LKTLALDECIASSPADYVRIAAELAHDPERLTQYRSMLRSAWRSSVGRIKPASNAGTAQT
jgi:predicted O-linked N-acetylglucosamine transferase (SPINDLY family)